MTFDTFTIHISWWTLGTSPIHEGGLAPSSRSAGLYLRKDESHALFPSPSPLMTKISRAGPEILIRLGFACSEEKCSRNKPCLPHFWYLCFKTRKDFSHFWGEGKGFSDLLVHPHNVPFASSLWSHTLAYLTLIFHWFNFVFGFRGSISSTSVFSSNHNFYFFSFGSLLRATPCPSLLFCDSQLRCFLFVSCLIWSCLSY